MGVDHQLTPIWNSTLHHIDDLPYDPIEFFPPTQSNMKNKQKNVKVRHVLRSPKKDDLPSFKASNEAVE